MDSQLYLSVLLNPPSFDGEEELSLAGWTFSAVQFEGKKEEKLTEAGELILLDL